MQQPHCRWVDTAFGGVQFRNKVMDARQVTSNLPERRQDLYITWHRFPEGYHDHWQQTGSTKGYKGPSYTDFIPFDFDGDDLSAVLQQVRQFLQTLEVTYEMDGLHGVRCFFSGKKGFHVCVSAALFGGWVPSPDLPKQLRRLALSLADGFKLDASIYDQNRLFRLPNSQHAEGLWKIPLTPAEVLTTDLEKIKAWAVQPRSLEWTAWDDALATEPAKAVWRRCQQRDETPEKSDTVPVEAVFSTGLKEGEGRDVAAFRIARTLRDQGVNSTMALEILRLWDQQQAPPLTRTDGADILEKKIANAYGDQPAGEDGPVTATDILTPTEMAHAYSQYIERLKRSKVFLGWSDLDTRLRGIAPGEVLTVIARSGVGKSAFLQNVLVNLAAQGVVSLFCSLEQPLPQCFERYVQLLTDRAGQQVEDHWASEPDRDQIIDTLEEKLGRITLTCGVSSLKIQQLGTVLGAAEEKAGQPIQVLAIDYLGLLDSTDLDKNLYAQTSKAARELKRIAKRHEVALLLLCQVSRAAGEEGDKPLTVHSARETGAIEESADFLLGLYRPDLHGEDHTIQVQILKNRKGAEGDFPFHFDKKSLRISEPHVWNAKQEAKELLQPTTSGPPPEWWSKA